MLLHCPTCERMFSPEGVQALPFCSSRCRQIDLGRWLKEGIGIPITPAAFDDEAESETAEGWFDEPEDD